jgi:hypothetical protein
MLDNAYVVLEYANGARGDVGSVHVWRGFI